MNKPEKYQICIDRLNAPEQRDVFGLYPNHESITAELVTDFELAILDKYREMDKPKIFQLFTVNESFKDLKIKLEKIKDALILLKTETDFGDWSFTKMHSSTKSVGFSFCSFMKILVPQFDTEGNRIPGKNEVEKILYIFEVDFVQLDKDITLVLIKFPPLMKEPNKLYNYGEETEFFLSWFKSKIKGLEITAARLKSFYQHMESLNEYDKSGFKAHELISGDTSVGATVTFDAGRNTTSKKAYSAIDKVIQPEMRALFLLEFEKLDEKLSAKQKSAISKAIDSMPFSEAYFKEILTKCSSGRGIILYSKGKIKVKYTLEFEKNCYPLVRVSIQGWGSFERLYGKIKEYLTEA